MTAETAKILLINLYRRLKAGEITESKAHKENQVLNSILKAIETTELEKRIESLEASLSTKK